MRVSIAAAVFALAPAAVFASPIAGGIKKIVSFGDSLTDTGVVAELTKDNGPWIPSNAYYKSRFSNGPVWLDYVVDSNGLEVENFAAGGATTSDALVQGWVGGKFGEPLRADGSIQKVPGVDTQISTYLTKQDEVKTNVLYTVFVGSNDLFDNQILNLGKSAADFANAQYGEWSTLAANGAKNILAIVLPGLLDPFYAEYGATLDTLLEKFKGEFPQVKIFKHEISIVAFVASLYNPPLLDATVQCCTDCFNGLPPVGNATICPSGGADYLIWDGLHPSTTVHKFIGDGISAFIAANYGF